MTKTEILTQLCLEAQSLFKDTKTAYDTEFLKYIFAKLNRKEIDIIPCLKVLGTAYSVARTVSIKTKQKQLRKLLGESKSVFEQYDITSLCPVSKDLKKLFSDTTCGSRKSGNTISSFISKYGYFITGQKFPIFDSMAKQTLSKVLLALGKEYDKGTDVITFLNNYAILLNALSKDVSFIPCTDAFLWLYGEMKNLDDNAVDIHTDADWWNRTCGFVGKENFQIWYNKAKKFLN